MLYKCTLIRDLPTHRAGTVFYMSVANELSNQHHKVFIGDSTNKLCGNGHPLFSIVNNKEWYTKEIVISCLTQLNCPKCGSSRVCIDGLANQESDWDDGVRYYSQDFLVRCICGHCYSLGRFWTHSKLEG